MELLLIVSRFLSPSQYLFSLFFIKKKFPSECRQGKPCIPNVYGHVLMIIIYKVFYIQDYPSTQYYGFCFSYSIVQEPLVRKSAWPRFCVLEKTVTAPKPVVCASPSSKSSMLIKTTTRTNNPIPLSGLHPNSLVSKGGYHTVFFLLLNILVGASLLGHLIYLAAAEALFHPISSSIPTLG